MPETLKVGVIGAGFIGPIHVWKPSGGRSWTRWWLCDGYREVVLCEAILASVRTRGWVSVM